MIAQLKRYSKLFCRIFQIARHSVHHGQLRIWVQKYKQYFFSSLFGYLLMGWEDAWLRARQVECKCRWQKQILWPNIYREGEESSRELRFFCLVARSNVCSVGFCLLAEKCINRESILLYLDQASSKQLHIVFPFCFVSGLCFSLPALARTLLLDHGAHTTHTHYYLFSVSWLGQSKSSRVSSYQQEILAHCGVCVFVLCSNLSER